MAYKIIAFSIQTVWGGYYKSDWGRGELSNFQLEGFFFFFWHSACERFFFCRRNLCTNFSDKFVYLPMQNIFSDSFTMSENYQELLKLLVVVEGLSSGMQIYIAIVRAAKNVCFKGVTRGSRGGGVNNIKTLMISSETNRIIYVTCNLTHPFIYSVGLSLPHALCSFAEMSLLVKQSVDVNKVCTLDVSQCAPHPLPPPPPPFLEKSQLHPLRSLYGTSADGHFLRKFSGF